MSSVSVLRPLVGLELLDILQVVAHIGDGEIVLCDTLIFSCAQGYEQLTVDVDAKSLRRMKDADDFRIVGDYQDASSFELRSLGLVTEPFQVASLLAVWEGDGETRYPVGVFMSDRNGRVRLGLNVHLDDAIAAEPILLLEYMAALVQTSNCLVITR